MFLHRPVITVLVLMLAVTIGWAAEPGYTVYMIPNTHGTVGGWLVNFDTERSYVLNNHLDHLDRVVADESYALAISEVPNVMALLKFAPERIEAIRRLAAERRVEFVNGFFLEPTVNLSGGEALAQMATLGQRWYQDVFGLRPRFAWMIDVCGINGQVPQIVSESGLEALFFHRNNPMPEDAFWWVSPDGTKTLTFALGAGYAAVRSLYNTDQPMSMAELQEMAGALEKGREYSASPRHVLMAAGGGDYSQPPRRPSYPGEFLAAWRQQYPNIEVRMTTPGHYVDIIQKGLADGSIKLGEYRGDAAYSYHAFWMNMPEMKRDYRKSEHLLQAAETIATAAALQKQEDYPAQGFYDSWIQMLLNMDRNILWGAGSGSPFYDSHHWNAWDRFASVQKQSGTALSEGIAAFSSEGESITFFNPLNWPRHDPVELTLPADHGLSGLECQARPGTDKSICVVNQPSVGMTSAALVAETAAAPRELPFENEVTTEFYIARFDPKNGSLVSLRNRHTGKEYLGGPANVVQAESVKGVVKDPTNWMAPRPMRKIVDSTSSRQAIFEVFRGPLAISVVARTGFAEGSRVERRVTFYHNYPRIDFETTLDLQTTNLVVTVDFPLAGAVAERTRGVPFGFIAKDPRDAKPPTDYFMAPDHRTYGYSEAIQPAVRWSDYGLASGGGVALLERGLSSHELNGNTITLGLVNAQDSYRGLDNVLLTGRGVRTLEYALWPHVGDWREEAIPRRAWEYNSPVIASQNRGMQNDTSFLTTSDNVIVEVVRRVEDDIEVRLAEWPGRGGEAEIALHLPHTDARLTNMMGEKARPVMANEGTYRFPVRPQQIVTLRFRAGSKVARPEAIRSWTPLTPRFKQAPLEVNEPVRGYPAITAQPTPEDFGAKVAVH